jgi:Beta-propeller repeat
MGKHFVSIAVVTAAIALILSAFRLPRSAPSTAGLLNNSHYGQLPLTFEPNQGQADPRVKFVSRNNGATVFLTSTGAVLALARTNPPIGKNLAWRSALRKDHDMRAVLSSISKTRVEGTVLSMNFEGANPAAYAEGMGLMPGKSNYLIGNDPHAWHTRIPNYTRVKYRNLYPGIDLVYYGHQGQLEYDLVAAPNSEPRDVRLRFQGADRVEINSAGEVIVQSGQGRIVLHKPRTYQHAGNNKETVAGGYRQLGPDSVGFQVAEYDHRKPLVIDPILSYSTYLGGFEAQSYGIAVDAQHNGYVTGFAAFIDDFPTTPGAFQTSLAPGGFANAFVTKLDPSGTQLLYSTYLGGSSLYTESFAIAVDSAGSAYVTGLTFDGFPIFPSPNKVFQGTFQSTSNGVNAFVAKLNPSGSGLEYSTYLGGNTSDVGFGIAVDRSGSAFVDGFTSSSNFPLVNQFQSNGGAFVSRLDPLGQKLLYSTYFVGANAIVADATGNAYVTGGAGPGFSPAINSSGGQGDAFVAKIDTTSSGAASLKYFAYVGGSSDDSASAIALRSGCSSDCDAYITGGTLSSDFPTTTGQSYGGFNDEYVAELNETGHIVYSRLLGGSFYDAGGGIAVDSSGKAYVTGTTHSLNFPVRHPIQPPGAPGGQLFESSDGGATLALTAWPGTTAGTVRSAVVDVNTTPHTYYIGTDHTGVWKSVDAGVSFTPTGLTAANVANQQVLSLAFVSPKTLYAGTAVGLFESTDGGVHFTQLTGIPPKQEVFFLTTDGNLLFAGTSGGWFTSSDGGGHFSRGSFPLSPITVFGGLVDNGKVYAATDKGVFVSNDSGSTFSATGVAGTACPDHMAVDTASTPHIVYASCDAGIIGSDDGFTKDFRIAGIPGAPFGVLVDNTSPLSPVPEGNPPTNPCPSTSAAPVYLGVQTQFVSVLEESQDCGNSFQPVGKFPPYNLLPNPAPPFGLADESIPILLDPATGTTPTKIFVHDSWEHDATITVLNPSGSNIIYSTRLGGNNDESGTAIAVDNEGGAYVTGITFSTDYPTTSGAAQPVLGEGVPFPPLVNGFIAKLTSGDQD